MKRFAKTLLLVNLSIIVVLIIYYPQQMLSPGLLVKGHALLEGDCFACHEPLFGTSPARCITCHKVNAIGVTTTKGVAIVEKKNKARFHHQLANHNCTECHSDHAGVAKYRPIRRMSHNVLEATLASQCSQCHQPPDDLLHRPASKQCNLCHGLEHWKPASIDHKPWFEFDKNHNVLCNRCHLENNTKTYTCTNCHEHSVDKIREKHLEEGIHDYERCVQCHRNADEDDAKRRWKSGGGKSKHEDD